MTIKIATPNTGGTALSTDFRNGSFELYLTGTFVRAHASLDVNLGMRSPFQNALGADGRPTQTLWVDDPAKYDIVFRNNAGVIIATGFITLAQSLAILDPTTTSSADYTELTWDGASQCTSYTSRGVTYTVTWVAGQRTRIECDSWYQTLTYPGGKLNVVTTKK